MLTMRRTPPLQLSAAQRNGLERLAAAGPPRAEQQAQSLLLSAQGMSSEEIGRTLSVSSNTVRIWRHLFERDGLDGLGVIARGRGRKRTLSDETVAEVVRLTLDPASAGPSAQWSTRSLARQLGISKDSVARIWAERGIAAGLGGRLRLGDGEAFERALVALLVFHIDPPLSTAVFSVHRGPPQGEAEAETSSARSPQRVELTVESPALRSIEASLVEVASRAPARHPPGAESIVALLDGVRWSVEEQTDIHVVMLDIDGTAAAVAARLDRWSPGHWYQHVSGTEPEWREAVSRWLQLTDPTALGDPRGADVDVLADSLAAWASDGGPAAGAFTWSIERFRREERRFLEDDGLTPGPPLPEPESAKPLVRSSPDEVAEQLRRAILQGVLAPGEHVRQPQWAEQLGVSRTVLREAFKILTGQHLLRHDPQSGYFVAKLNVEEMRQLYRLTAFVEEEILRKIRWPTRNEITVLDQQFLEYYEAFLAGNLIGAIDHWQAYLFHLYSLSSETFLIKEGIRLFEIATPYRMIVFTTMLLQDPSLSEIAIARHDQIAALRARDLSRFIKSIIYDRLPEFESYATHSEIMAFFRRVPTAERLP
jgi:DNA-binding GntR family transcriptional regulator/transposase